MSGKPAKPRPKGPGRLSADEAARLPDRLLDAAQSVFISVGYARATMDAIAAAAGASRKTLYARYANKAEILASVVNRLLDAALADAAPKGAPAVDDPRAALLKLARELASLSEASQVAGLNRLIFAEAYQAPDLARLFLDLHTRAAENVQRTLETLHEEGALPLMPCPRFAALIFVEMVASMPRLRALLGAPLSKKETNKLTAAAVDIFLRGCGAR
ncbi:MAG: TetR/AcrR family transcriptional regulator C-terminal domain-containing protein [Hyphomonadaceae bacterium]|nr:TetR/AcrR family transcriptional regulator C-terminal domain-containing protein [Hyphomonadaceae bacterium]